MVRAFSVVLDRGRCHQDCITAHLRHLPAVSDLQKG